jgi:hypothetical protein
MINQKASPITQASEEELTPTCSQCPLFRDYEDDRGRGLCLSSEEIVRKHHKASQNCGVMANGGEKPKLLKVKLDSKEGQCEDDGNSTPVHSFYVAITVTKKTQREVEDALADYLDEFVISSIWEPSEI